VSRKRLLPRVIYDSNPCGNFAPIDCGSMVGPLMESELFGRTEGAFTGAAQAKRGLIDLATGGTAFFDRSSFCGCCKTANNGWSARLTLNAKHLQAAFSRAKNVYTVLGRWQ
jgi:Sigma-54 interaction domain